MDTTETGSNAVREMQIPLLEPTESAQTGQTKEEIKRQKRRVWTKAFHARHRNDPAYQEKLRVQSKQYYWNNVEKCKERARNRYARNPEKFLERSRVYFAIHREEKIEYDRTYYKLNRASKLNRDAKRRKQLKLHAMLAYGGPICRCCGECDIEFLSIDHIENGKGNPANRSAFGSSIYPWLKKHHYPSGFQVLCFQCNLAKGAWGVCPHTQLKTPIDLFLGI